MDAAHHRRGRADGHRHGCAHGHDHDHHRGGHRHGRGGHHHHAPASFDRAFAIGAALNVAFVAAQAFYGLVANSMALLADAAHNLGDVVGLLLAWGAAWAGRRRPTARGTYGWGRASILASLANAVLLLLGCGAIAVEALRRFGEPQAVAGSVVMAVAALGILVNGGTALLFARGRHGDLNIRGAFLHMVADAAVSAAVVLAGLAIQLTGRAWIDPAASLLVVAVITWGTWGLLRDAAGLALDRVPGGIDPVQVASELRALPGVVEVHDLHIWALSTTETALTVHLVTADPRGADALVEAAGEVARGRGINHTTVQVETEAVAGRCVLRPAGVV